jgi:hypothetical protein
MSARPFRWPSYGKPSDAPPPWAPKPAPPTPRKELIPRGE